MARKPRVHYEGALYHVMCRGNNKEKVFESSEDKREYLKIIKMYKEKLEFNLYAYCIMDNHAHLLIQIRHTPLSVIMQRIQQVYTQRYNKRYERTGHVFEQRYQAKLCQEDQYLLSLIRYIHKNPKEAKIKEGIKYNWSSHLEYIGDRERNVTDIAFPLLLFSKNRQKAVKEYLAFMEEEENENFKEWEETNAGQEQKEKKAKKRDSKELIEIIENKSEIKIADIRGRSLKRDVAAKRKIVVFILKNYSNSTNKEISEILGLSQQAITNILNRGLENVGAFRETYDRLVELCNCEA